MEYESWDRATGPKTRDALHEWIHENIGIDIPRIAVCGDLGHCAPFDALADIYFEETLAAIWMANRGGAKTMLAAMWHLLSAKFKPGCECLSVGAILEQANRCYDNLRSLIRNDRSAGGPFGTEADHPEIIKSLMSETLFANGSKVEVVPGTESAVNGPHNQHLHFDELELAKPKVFQESRNITQSREGHKGQDLITSTRKRAHGLMQSVLNDCMDAERQGFEPPYKRYTWCIFECAERQDNCQSANPDLPEEERCNCDKVVKGKWEGGAPRTFKDVCQGRLARSGGWIPIHDIHKVFRTADRQTWEAQQECAKPSTHGLVLKEFERQRHGIRWYDPDPANGPIYMSVDFGGTNPHAVVWVQVLKYDVDTWGFHQNQDEEPRKRLKEGTHVVFDEIYIAEVGNMDVARMVVEREQKWRARYPKFRVAMRFYDVQGKAARTDWAKHNPPLVCQNFTTKDVKEHVKQLRSLTEDDKLVVDVRRCPMSIEELEAWHFPEKDLGMVDDPDKPVEDFDHTISAIRYLVSNVRSLMRRLAQHRAMPAAAESPHGTGSASSGTGAGPSRYLPVDGRPGSAVYPLPRNPS